MKKSIAAAAAALTLAGSAMAAPANVTWTFDWSGTLTIYAPPNCDPDIFVCETEFEPLEGTFVLTEPADYYHHDDASTGVDGYRPAITIDVRHGQLIEYSTDFNDLADGYGAHDVLHLTGSGGTLTGEGYIGPWLQYSTIDETYTLASRVSSVPEPAGAALILAGWGLVAAKRRKT